MPHGQRQTGRARTQVTMSSSQLPALPGLSPLEEIFQAIDDEISASARDLSRSVLVTDGVRLHRGIGGALYSFRADLAVPFQPETPIEIHHGDERTRGALVAVEDFDLVVHLRDDIGREVPSGSLTSSPTFILERLRERLDSVVLRPELPGAGVPGATWQPDEAIVGIDHAPAEATSQALAKLDDPALQPNPSQRQAMAMPAGSNLHFVWGPPGTGKTSALAQTARMLADNGERVLVLAHANVAVDVAMVRLADAFAGTKDIEDGRVLRVGDPHHPDARERTEILVETAVQQRRPELAQERKVLEQRRRTITRDLRTPVDDGERDLLAADLGRVRERLVEISGEYRNETALAIADAQVIGSTLSRLVLSDDVWEWRPDAILLDEASMVSFPWVLLAATRVAKRLIVFGDFRQLPPVYLAQTDLARRWLGSDAFEVAGVRTRIDDGDTDPRVTLLDTQYRMAPAIGDTISALAYGGRLHTDKQAGARSTLLADAQPFPSASVVIVDTSELAPWCQIEAKSGSFSRVNPLHTLLGLSLAEQAGDDVALITPYRAQSRLHAAGIPDLGLPRATAATIHRYQGSERDAVVFDVVDSAPIDGPSRLTGGDLDLALRLVNVGLSRARGKVVVLADLELLEDRFAPESPVRRAFELCAERGTLVTPTAEDLPGLFARGTVAWVSGPDAVNDLLAHELGASRLSFIFNVPRGVALDPSVVTALEAAAGRCTAGAVLGEAATHDSLEQLPIELRLLASPGLALCVDESRVVIGARDLRVAASVTSPKFASAVRSTLFLLDRALPADGAALRALPASPGKAA